MTSTHSTEIRSLRRRAADSSLLAFARLYLPHRFTLPWCRMHREVSDALSASDAGPVRIAIAAPDGYGKSSLVTFAFVLWSLATQQHRCIVLGSSRRSAAGEFLRAIDMEIRRNTKLRSDYPHLAALARSSGASGSRASPPRDLYVGGVARLTTIGPTTRLGEISFEGMPPDLFVLDGFEDWNGEEVDLNDPRSTAAILERFLERKILDRFTSASVIVLGSLTHANGLIDRLFGPRGRGVWDGRHYCAVETYPDGFDRWFTWAKLHESDPEAAAALLESELGAMTRGVRLLWPEQESFQRMMTLRAERGWAWFDRYRQGSPPGGCLRLGTPSTRLSIDGEESADVIADDAGYRRMNPIGPAYCQNPQVQLVTDESLPGRPIPVSTGESPSSDGF